MTEVESVDCRGKVLNFGGIPNSKDLESGTVGVHSLSAENIFPSGVMHSVELVTARSQSGRSAGHPFPKLVTGSFPLMAVHRWPDPGFGRAVQSPG